MHKKKRIFVIIIIAFLFCCIFKTVYAAQIEDIVTVASASSINPNDYEPSDLTESYVTIGMLNNVIGAFQAIGSIVSVLALVLLGIKFALGSAEEKAEYKQWMIYYVIGAILVFAISNISAMIYNAINS